MPCIVPRRRACVQCSIGTNQPEAGELQVGAAMRVITPNPLLPVSGGMGTPNPTREKKGDLTARAVVFRNGDVSVAVVALDLIGFPSVLGDRVRAQVSRIPADHILIGSTHTHSAPDCYAFPDGKGGHTGDLKYMDFVCNQAAEALNEAIDRLEPASIKIATGEAQGKIAYNYYAPDLYDRRMSVIQARNAQGKTHRNAGQLRGPSRSARQRRRHSQPRPGRPALRKARGNGRRHGDFHEQCPRGHGHRRQPKSGSAQGPCSADTGTMLAPGKNACGSATSWRARPCASSRSARAEGTQALLRFGQRAISGRIGDNVGRRHRLTAQIPSQRRPFRSTLESISSTWATPRFLTIPGEALPNIGFYLKRKMHGKHNLLFGLTNEAFGYILTKVDFHSFPRYDYVSRTSLGEMTGEILIEKSLELVNKSPSPVH